MIFVKFFNLIIPTSSSSNDSEQENTPSISDDTVKSEHTIESDSKIESKTVSESKKKILKLDIFDSDN